MVSESTSGSAVNLIPTCGACWAALAPGARFCEHCGAVRGHQPAPPEAESDRAPGWFSADWSLAVALTALVAVTMVALCTAYGLALGALAAGSAGLLPGALAGALLPLAALGAEVVIFSGNRQESVVLLLDQVPLVLTALTAVVTWLVLRGGVARLAPDRPRARALVGKVAVLLSALVLVAGGFVDVGGVDTFGPGTERQTLASVEQGSAALGALLLVAAVGAVLLVRAKVSVTGPLPVNLRRALLAGRAGAATFAVVGLATGLAGLLVLTAHVDGGRERLAVLASAPLTLSGFSTAGSAVAHGGAVGSTDVEEGLNEAIGALELDLADPRGFGLDQLDPQAIVECEQEAASDSQVRECIQDLLNDLIEQQGADGEDPDQAYRDALRLSSIQQSDQRHLSLWDWQLPLTDQRGTAPWWAFSILLVPLGALVGATLLLLRRANPPTEGWAVRLAVLLGLGYALTCAVVAELSPQAVVAMGSSLDAGDFGLLLVPSLGSSLGLPLLWGLLLPAATALVWSRRHDLPGNVFAGLGALPVRPPLLCPGCAATVLAGDAFCAGCGRPQKADGADRKTDVVD